MNPGRYFVVFFAIPLCFSVARCNPFEGLEKPSNRRALSPLSAPQSVFNVLSHGASGNGERDDTMAFNTAWDLACQSDIRATILVPCRYTFMVQCTIFTGPCRNAVVFQIEGSLMPPDGPGSWPKIYSKRQWLVFYRVNGMSMQGSGIIDGRGEKWWDLACKPHRGVNGTTLPGPCDSPAAIRFFQSSNLMVKGLKMVNSPQFHFRFDNCRNVRLESLHIKSPASSPNTDGIHIAHSNDVMIYNSVIANGDDCVSIGAGSYNVHIRNITCGPSHGISIGSLGIKNSSGCVSNVTVSDSVIKQSKNGVRIKTWQGGSGSVSRVSFARIRMDTVRNPIIIDQYYCDSAASKSEACPNQTSAVHVTTVSYHDISGTYDARGPPVHFACSDSVPCTNLRVSRIDLSPAGGRAAQGPFCWNAYGAQPALCLAKGYPPPELIWASGAHKC